MQRPSLPLITKVFGSAVVIPTLLIGDTTGTRLETTVRPWNWPCHMLKGAT